MGKERGEKMTSRIPKRKVVGVTFVMADDYVNDKAIPEKVRYKYLQAIKNTMQFVGLDSFDIIAMNAKDYIQKLNEKKIPELWADDITGQSDRDPVCFYYVIDFNDNSRKMLFFLDREVLNRNDPMFQ